MRIRLFRNKVFSKLRSELKFPARKGSDKTIKIFTGRMRVINPRAAAEIIKCFD